MISDEYRFVYMAVPKVATTSIKTALLPLLGLDDTYRRERDVHKAFGQGVHKIYRHAMLHESKQSAKLHESKQSVIKGLEGRYRDYFKFAFVRNPYDRLVSCYAEKIRPKKIGIEQGPYGGVSLRPGMSFREFAEAVCQIPDEEADVHFRSQYVGVCGDGPDRPVLVDFLGRYENLEDDFSRVGEAIGAPLSLPPNPNPSKRRAGRHYRDFYDDELAEMVGERYREDVRIFGYSF